jgi:hypothetical protein
MSIGDIGVETDSGQCFPWACLWQLGLIRNEMRADVAVEIGYYFSIVIDTPVPTHYFDAAKSSMAISNRKHRYAAPG